jgi:hypothetical protein
MIPFFHVGEIAILQNIREGAFGVHNGEEVEVTHGLRVRKGISQSFKVTEAPSYIVRTRDRRAFMVFTDQLRKRFEPGQSWGEIRKQLNSKVPA